MYNVQFGPMEWIEGPADDPRDRCAHGSVSVTMGERVLSYDCCTSAAAMRMLRTLTEDHEIGDCWAGQQMLPCCGHELYAEGESVVIFGCPNGVDYAVRHEGDMVCLTTEDGETYAVSFAEYLAGTMPFLDALEAFYRSASPKIFYADVEKAGYEAFWKEWNRRRNDLKIFLETRK